MDGVSDESGFYAVLFMLCGSHRSFARSLFLFSVSLPILFPYPPGFLVHLDSLEHCSSLNSTNRKRVPQQFLHFLQQAINSNCLFSPSPLSSLTTTIFPRLGIQAAYSTMDKEYKKRLVRTINLSIAIVSYIPQSSK